MEASGKDPRQEVSEKDRKQFLDAAHRFCSEARELILGYWQAGSFEIKSKADASPVTIADLEAEQLLRDRIGKHFPGHGIIGEEYQRHNADAEFQWTIDPIDGTQNFAAGIPTFGTMVSLRFRNRPIVAIIDHPAFELRYHAAFEMGTFRNDEPVRIFDKTAPALTPDLIVNTSTRGMFERTKQGWLLDRFMKLHPTTRIYYDCYGHSLTVGGHLAGTVEFNVRLWDISPTELLVEEAGGVFAQLGGGGGDPTQDHQSAIFGRASVVMLLHPLFHEDDGPEAA